jgi:hypothetical protein
MYPIQHRLYRDGIDNLLVLLIGGIPIAMPTVLSVTMAIGSHRLSDQGAITKRMTAIEEMAAMDVLCSDKTGTLTLNKLSVDRGLIEVFVQGLAKDEVIFLAARASRVENQDAIDTAMVGMLDDPKEARAGIREEHFLPFNPVDKRTALTYVDLADGSWHRVSKGAPEQATHPHPWIPIRFDLSSPPLLTCLLVDLADSGSVQMQPGREEQGARHNRQVRRPGPPVARRGEAGGAGQEEGQPWRAVGVRRPAAAARPAAPRQRRDHKAGAPPRRQRQDDHRYTSTHAQLLFVEHMVGVQMQSVIL